MRSNRRALIIGAVVASAVCGLRCTRGPVAGTITQSGNGIVSGSVIYSGDPVADARVLLIPSSYNPVADAPLPDSLIDTTGPSGEFAIVASARSSYNVVAEHASGKNALVTGVSFEEGATQTTAPLLLEHPGAITVAVNETAGTDSAYVYIPGTSCFSVVQGGMVTLLNVPSGTIPEVRYALGDTGSVSRVIKENITVTSGDTTTIADYSLWNSMATIRLNTTVTGADVAGTVTDFPLLIRLTSVNFDFSHAAAGGTDIRFSTADGAPLAFEIERWDPAARLAEVWVSVDTLRGADSTQSIVMYWGNPDVSDGSDAAAVFDTANGFAGVWHLHENGAAMRDATVNGIDGVATATTMVAGAVGTAQEFDGTSSFVQASGPAADALNFPEDGAYSVSAWVRTDVLDSLFHGIVYKSNLQYGLQMRPEKVWEFLTFTDEASWEMSRAPVEDTVWHYLVGVRNGAEQYLYLDGLCVDSAMVTVAMNGIRDYEQPLEIGHCPDGGDDPDRFYDGIIDEVRISKVARSSDWIRLCYVNQKDGDALVRW